MRCNLFAALVALFSATSHVDAIQCQIVEKNGRSKKWINEDQTETCHCNRQSQKGQVKLYSAFGGNKARKGGSSLQTNRHALVVTSPGKDDNRWTFWKNEGQKKCKCTCLNKEKFARSAYLGNNANEYKCPGICGGNDMCDAGHRKAGALIHDVCQYLVGRGGGTWLLTPDGCNDEVGGLDFNGIRKCWPAVTSQMRDWFSFLSRRSLSESEDMIEGDEDIEDEEDAEDVETDSEDMQDEN